MVLARLIERLHVQLRHAAPHHIAAQLIGVFSHGMPHGLIVQEFNDGVGDGLRISKGHQFSPFFRKQFRRVPIGR